MSVGTIRDKVWGLDLLRDLRFLDDGPHRQQPQGSSTLLCQRRLGQLRLQHWRKLGALNLSVTKARERLRVSSVRRREVIKRRKVFQVLALAHSSRADCLVLPSDCSIATNNLVWAL